MRARRNKDIRWQKRAAKKSPITGCSYRTGVEHVVRLTIEPARAGATTDDVENGSSTVPLRPPTAYPAVAMAPTRACGSSSVRNQSTYAPASPVGDHVFLPSTLLEGCSPPASACSVCRITAVALYTVSGLSEMLSVPSSTRKRAKSG
jgi:hypothetical protein